ncbi:histidine kinase [Peptostreptococcus sp. MV1]|uniref:sensor histidine kinase n=1 Tax=Peptostreptococcus sp. MV1 TaxID=1219626 RepID=UPI00050FD2AA|nr:HAMP domain-containing sensor histidine kinase [Peptostreptococcus sp. MV1]KGF14382.1 histidine kinase [Peptostreptococcus sp. MV1]
MINNNVFDRTKKKLTMTIMCVVEIFMILVSCFIYNYFKFSVISGIDNNIAEEYHFVKNQFKKDSIMNPISLQDPKDILYIYEDKSILYYTRNRYFGISLPTNNMGKEDGFIYENVNGYNFRSLIVKEDNNYRFKIMRNIDSEILSMGNMLTLLILVDTMSLLLVYVIARYLSSKALKPIETSWNNQVKFVQDASHELRTPVAIIQSKLESLLKQPDVVIEEEAETIAVAMRETRQLKKMISELLSLTKEESIVKLNIERVDIEALFKETFESYIEIADYQEKTFDYQIKMKNNIIYTDKNKLNQLIRIFVDNAFKYTETSDKISITASEKGRDRIIILIEDTGIGISDKDQKRIFERFFRSDSVRATEVEGSGIGLSIAKLIAITLYGNIKVKSKLGQGTSFTIDLPRGKEIKSKSKSD